jgi:hypothetical protein
LIATRHHGGRTLHIAEAEQHQPEYWPSADLLVILPLFEIGIANIKAPAVTATSDNRQRSNLRPQQQVDFFGPFVFATFVSVSTASSWHGAPIAAEAAVTIP